MATSESGKKFNRAAMGRQAAELAKRFESTAVELDSAILQALEICGIKVEGSASYNVPVDTGLLRKSIAHVTTRDETGVPTEYVGTNVEYAPFVEFGTVKQDPQPFLTPALNSNSGFVNQRIKLALQGKIDEVGRKYAGMDG